MPANSLSLLVLDMDLKVRIEAFSSSTSVKESLLPHMDRRIILSWIKKISVIFDVM